VEPASLWCFSLVPRLFGSTDSLHQLCLQPLKSVGLAKTSLEALWCVCQRTTRTPEEPFLRYYRPRAPRGHCCTLLLTPHAIARLPTPDISATATAAAVACSMGNRLALIHRPQRCAAVHRPVSISSFINSPLHDTSQTRRWLVTSMVGWLVGGY